MFRSATLSDNVDVTALEALQMPSEVADVLTRYSEVPRHMKPLLYRVVLLHFFKGLKGHVRLHTVIVSVFQCENLLRGIGITAIVRQGYLLLLRVERVKLRG